MEDVRGILDQTDTVWGSNNQAMVCAQRGGICNVFRTVAISIFYPLFFPLFLKFLLFSLSNSFGVSY